ncbi:MAG: L-lysine dehydrogenase [Proteobacteria bacterium]|nr:L-lysine dehydrogenase [Pseudomonadota bacterium]
MSGKIKSVLVLGMGKVGSLAGVLLNRTGFSVTGMDMHIPDGLPFKTVKGDVSSKMELEKAMSSVDAVVSCLPYHLNTMVATVAHSKGLHYFDLTEDVASTQAILELSKNSKGVMAPQCGLAPGFIGIVGADLAKGFDTLRSIKMRVGALPQHPTGLLGYAFNWSTEGLVNEYLNDCEVIEDGEHKLVPPLEDLETIVINGVQLEAFTTSGGLGTMCETYDGKVKTLNYKTIRYPGHAQLMQFFFNELYMKDDRQMAGKILLNAKPPVNEDVVYVHASAEGVKNGKMFREEFVRGYYPLEIDGQVWRAIAWTTAGSLCAVIEMVNNGTLPSKGFIHQENIPLDAFLATKNGSLYAKSESGNGSSGGGKMRKVA